MTCDEKPTERQLALIADIEVETDAKFKGETRMQACSFIDENLDDLYLSRELRNGRYETDAGEGPIAPEDTSV